MRLKERKMIFECLQSIEFQPKSQLIQVALVAREITLSQWHYRKRSKNTQV